MKTSELSKRRTLLFGLAAFVIGFLVFFNGREVTSLTISLVALYFFGVALVDLFLHFVLKRREISVTSNLIKLALAAVIFFLNEFTNLPLHFIVVILGCYQLFMAGIYGVTYTLFRQSKIKGGGRFLFDALLYGPLGLSSIISPGDVDGELQFLFLGAYLISLGFSNIRDGLFFDNERDRKNLRRRVRVSLPIIFAAFIPAEQLSRFNQFLQGDAPEEEKESRQLVMDKDLSTDMEVFIHTSDKDLFGAIGHVDLCYKGKVISFGSYDPFSERLFGTVGDGVLFKVDKDAYIDFCKRESKKTLFGYSLHLTEEQKKAVEERLAEIDSLVYDWEPSVEFKNDQHIYPYRLKHELGAEIYKFKDSRFKTYFVLSTNCVLLADSILGQAGTDIVNPRGVIAPGTYQSYLQYELESSKKLVIAETIY